jgi:hypothetical protein
MDNVQLSCEHDHLWRVAVYILVKLANNSGKLPSFLFIGGILLESVHAAAHGGFADVYRAKYRGQQVALKRARLEDHEKEGFHLVSTRHLGPLYKRSSNLFIRTVSASDVRERSTCLASTSSPQHPTISWNRCNDILNCPGCLHGIPVDASWYTHEFHQVHRV